MDNAINMPVVVSLSFQGIASATDESLGVTCKNFAKIGIIGCTQYKDEKEAKPAKNKDHKIAVNDFEPYSIWVGRVTDSDMRTPSA